MYSQSLSMKTKNAVFLDRDGTLIHDKGFITDPDDVFFYRLTFEALRMLQGKFELFIISNQSGIAKDPHPNNAKSSVLPDIINQGYNTATYARDASATGLS